MQRWRYALVTYLREALRRGLLQTDLAPQALRVVLTIEYERWWNVDVQPGASEEHFIRYAGRYVRRPLLAQYHIINHSSEKVSFRTHVHKMKEEVVTEYGTPTFIKLLADHIPGHYQNGSSNFGLLSPHSRGRTFGALFAQLRQAHRQQPHHLSWARSIEREFGHHP